MGGSWSSITNYDAPGTSGPHQGCSFYPTVAIGNDGTTAVAWPTNTSCNGNVTVWRTLAAVYKPGTGWDASPQAWGLSPINVNSYPDVAVADDGSVIVAVEAATTVNDSYVWTISTTPSGTLRNNAARSRRISARTDRRSGNAQWPHASSWFAATTVSSQWRKFQARGSRFTVLPGLSTAAVRTGRRSLSTDLETRTSFGRATLATSKPGSARFSPTAHRLISHLGNERIGGRSAHRGECERRRRRGVEGLQQRGVLRRRFAATGRRHMANHSNRDYSPARRRNKRLPMSPLIRTGTPPRLHADGQRLRQRVRHDHREMTPCRRPIPTRRPCRRVRRRRATR